MQNGYVALFAFPPPAGLSSFRYLVLNSVTFHRRYLLPSILPPQALLARWLLAVISLAARAACSEWEGKTERGRGGEKKEKRGALSSSVVLSFSFSVELSAVTGKHKSSHVWKGLFFLPERRLFPLTGRCVEEQVALFCSTRVRATS